MWQTQGVIAAVDQSSQVLARAHETPGSVEIFVRTPDRIGVFAALVATLDRMGLSVLDARILNSSDGYALDNFQAQASGESVDPALIVQLLQQALLAPAAVKPARRAMPRHLKHFRVAARIEFDLLDDGRRLRLALVGTDRPGLLADVAQVLRGNRLRVHDARIATFGERVEDFFLLSNQDDRAFDSESLATMRSELIACLEGDSTGDSKKPG